MADRQLETPSSLSGKPPSSSPAAAGSAPSHIRAEWALLHVGFIAIGIVTTLIGNVLPTFIKHWSLTDAQAGFLIAAQFTGSTLATLLTSVLLPRFGFARVLCSAFLSCAIGFAFLGTGPWFLAAAAVFVYGAGYGFANPATNLRATQIPSKNVAAAVTFLNFSWTVGAVSCPFVVGLLVPKIGVRGIAIGLMVASVMIAAAHFGRALRSAVPRAERSRRSVSEWISRLAQAPSVSLVLIFFLYVGAEVGTGSWLATQEKRMPGGSETALLIAPSFFYGFLLIGRAIAPLFMKHFSTLSISLAGLAGIVLGVAIIIQAHQPHWLFAGAALAGIGCAPQYPIFITWLAQTFGEDSNWLSPLFFAASSAGGAVLPWVMGIVGEQANSLRAGFALPLVACVAMMIFVLRAHPRAVAA